MKKKLNGLFGHRAAKPVVFLCALLPFMLLVKDLLAGQLGANPIDTLTNRTGTLAIQLLMIGLALTPLRMLLKQTWPIRFRRMIGLFAFFYVIVHLSIYLVLDQQLDMGDIIDDLLKRPYIFAGATAFMILLPMAATSTKGMVRRLGKHWMSLHRWVYIAATAAVLHYVLLAKGDLIEPYIYLNILLLLLGFRFVKQLR